MLDTDVQLAFPVFDGQLKVAFPGVTPYISNVVGHHMPQQLGNVSKSIAQDLTRGADRINGVRARSLNLAGVPEALSQPAANVGIRSVGGIGTVVGGAGNAALGDDHDAEGNEVGALERGAKGALTGLIAGSTLGGLGRRALDRAALPHRDQAISEYNTLHAKP